MKLSSLVAAGLAAAALVGCGGDHEHDHAGAHDGCGLEANCTADLLRYRDGMVVSGDVGNLKIRIVSATPAPRAPKG